MAEGVNSRIYCVNQIALENVGDLKHYLSSNDELIRRNFD
jgi:hypothetical protein